GSETRKWKFEIRRLPICVLKSPWDSRFSFSGFRFSSFSLRPGVALRASLFRLHRQFPLPFWILRLARLATVWNWFSRFLPRLFLERNSRLHPPWKSYVAR